MLGTVAAVAGGAAWVSGVGSVIVAVRLQKADLPSSSVVALIPAEHRFALGASYLLAPLFVGLVGFLADVALTAHWTHSPAPADPTSRQPRIAAWWDRVRREPACKRERLKTRGPLAVVTLVLGTIVGIVLLRPPLLWLFLIQIVAIVGIVAVVFALGPDEGKGLGERAVVFALVLITAGVLAFGFEQLRDPKFDFGAIRLKDHSVLAGFYVTSTANAVLLIHVSRRPANDRM